MKSNIHILQFFIIILTFKIINYHLVIQLLYMGPCFSNKKQNLLETQKITTLVIEQPINSQKVQKLYFKKEQATYNDPSTMFQLSLITLNKPTVSQNSSKSSTQISVCLQGSEIFSDEISIIMETKAFLKKMNNQRCPSIIIIQPSQFDFVSRRTLFVCIARAIKQFESEIDLIHIRNIQFCWDKEEVQKIYKLYKSSINADFLLRVCPSF